MRATRSTLSVQITRSLRHGLEEAREKSGRTLTGEVEARLRNSLKLRSADDLILLKPDSGLMAWLRAYAATDLFLRDFESVLIYELRGVLLQADRDPQRLRRMIALLPSRLRDACDGMADCLEAAQRRRA